MKMVLERVRFCRVGGLAQFSVVLSCFAHHFPLLLHIGQNTHFRTLRMIVEVGNYTFPEQVGYRGWVAFEKYVAFEGLDGQVTIVERPN